MFEEFHEHFAYVLELGGRFISQRENLYASLIEFIGSPFDKVVGFIDITKICFCRAGCPNINQRTCYSGHHKCHCPIYQTITTPYKRIFALHGIIESRRHAYICFAQLRRWTKTRLNIIKSKRGGCYLR